MKEMTDIEKTAERLRKVAEQGMGQGLKAMNDFYEIHLGRLQALTEENEALRKQLEEFTNVESGEPEEGPENARASRA